MNWQQILRVLSVVLILTGISILGLTFYPVVKLEVTYHPQRNQEIVPLDTDLGIVIPKIGANAKIIPHVDTANSVIYQNALTQGVAHAQGTPLPGDQGNAFLFSHSSVNFLEAAKYNSVFYLLTKLEPGDPIYIYRNNQKLTFKVTDKKIVNPDAVSYLTSPAMSPSLTLMTCWPAGTTLKRLIVQAVPAVLPNR